MTRELLKKKDGNCTDEIMFDMICNLINLKV